MPVVEVNGRAVSTFGPQAGGSGAAGASGGGQTVLLVHGAFDTHGFWQHVQPSLDARHRVISVDLPGHGDSAGPALVGASAYLDFFTRLVEALDLPRFVFCGHSMGGSMAVDYALAHPGRLAGLLPLSSAPDWDISPADIAQWDEDSDGAFVTNEGYLFAADTSQSIRDDYGRQIRTTAPANCRSDLETCRTFDLRGRLSEVSTPTLVVSGDQEFWLEGSQLLHAGISAAKLELVGGAGHAIAFEQPAQLAQVINAFLAGLPG